MKTTLVSFLLLLSLTISSCSEKVNNKLVDKQLQAFLDKKDFFKLRDKLKESKSKLADHRFLYYQAFVDKALGENQLSNESINVLLQNFSEKFQDSIMADLISLKGANYVDLFEYKNAANTFKDLVRDYAKVLDSTEIEDFKNATQLYAALQEVDKQMIQRHNEVKIKSFFNKFNHLMVPTKIHDISSDFIFDTDANLSTISESQAKLMNLTFLENVIKVGTVTQVKINSKIAVADQMDLGGIIFKNVPFLVMPDEDLSFPEVNYKINGIIGFPLIKQLKEVHLGKDGTITIPGTTRKSNLNNLFLDGLTPVVQAYSGTESLILTLDTGAQTTDLSYKYFKKHEATIKSSGKIAIGKSGGAGGVTVKGVYQLPDFEIKVGTKKAILPTVSIMREQYDFLDHFDGNLGQDFFMQFNALIINFEDMYVDFK